MGCKGENNVMIVHSENAMPTEMQTQRSTDDGQLFVIVPYESRYQQQVEDLVLPIQQIEFAVNITREQQPDLMDIPGTFQKGLGNFWLAVSAGVVVGCVGVVDFGGNRVALKKMFVHRDFRGKAKGVSSALFAAVRAWCQTQAVSAIWLGTIAQMTAAHNFYRKNGFVEVSKEELPSGFPLVTVDNKFFRCDLK